MSDRAVVPNYTYYAATTVHNREIVQYIISTTHHLEELLQYDGDV